MADDQFDRLRSLIAAQHRDCVAQSEELRAARAAIRRSRRLLLELEQQESFYTKPFPPGPKATAPQS